MDQLGLLQFPYFLCSYVSKTNNVRKDVQESKKSDDIGTIKKSNLNTLLLYVQNVYLGYANALIHHG